MHREDYLEALRARDRPEAANRALVVDFEAALARTINAGLVKKEIDELLERFVAPDYRQHDEMIGNGRIRLAAFFRRGAFGTEPPPPIAVLADADLVSVLLQFTGSGGPGGRLFVTATFRVEDGRLAKHW